MKDDQRRHALLVSFLTVGLLGLAGIHYLDVQRENEAAVKAEAVEKQRQEDQFAEEKLNALLQRFSDGDQNAIIDFAFECISAAESSSRFGMTLQYRDYRKVEAALRDLHPYDTERKLIYVTMPNLSSEDFFSLLARQTIERREKTGEASLIFAVTYTQDSFIGLVDFYGLLNCPFRGDALKEPWVDVLYNE